MKASDGSPYDFAEPAKPSARLAPHAAAPARTAAPATPLTPAAAPASTECPFCGYTHKGKARARCPECSAPMDASLADQLAFSDPPWVRRAGWGAVLLSASVAAHAVAILARIVQVLWTSDTAKHVKGVTHAAAAVALALGVLALFWPEPRRPGGSSAGARAAAWLLAGAALLLWMIMAYWALREARTAAPTLRLAVNLVLLCHLPLSAIMAMRMRTLAGRIPDDALTWQASYSGWLTAGVCVFALALLNMSLLEGYGLAFFPISFPLIAAVTGVLLWAAFTALRIGLNMLAAASAGADIALRKAGRAASKRADQPGRSA
jgi:hypothetical protein